MFIVKFFENHMGNVAGTELGFDSREAADRACRQLSPAGSPVARIVREEPRAIPVVFETPKISAAAQAWRAANGFEPIVTDEPPAPPAPVSAVPAVNNTPAKRKV